VHQVPKRMDSRAEALASTSEHCMQWMIEGANGKMVMFVASAVRTSPEHTSHVAGSISLFASLRCDRERHVVFAHPLLWYEVNTEHHEPAWPAWSPNARTDCVKCCALCVDVEICFSLCHLRMPMHTAPGCWDVFHCAQQRLPRLRGALDRYQRVERFLHRCVRCQGPSLPSTCTRSTVAARQGHLTLIPSRSSAHELP
jgi:hypothetical protein